MMKTVISLGRQLQNAEVIEMMIGRGRERREKGNGGISKMKHTENSRRRSGSKTRSSTLSDTGRHMRSKRERKSALDKRRLR